MYKETDLYYWKDGKKLARLRGMINDETGRVQLPINCKARANQVFPPYRVDPTGNTLDFDAFDSLGGHFSTTEYNALRRGDRSYRPFCRWDIQHIDEILKRPTNG